MAENEQRWPRLRWIVGFLLLAALLALGVGAIAWSANARRHKATTYGVADPSSAALNVENRTADFAITRVSIEDETGVTVIQEVREEINTGASAAFEVAPGTYLVRVSYVEIMQVVGGRPKGFLDMPVSVSPGKAVILRLQGGRSSPEHPVFFPPELVVK